MDNDEAGDAEAEQAGGSNESAAEGAGGMKAAMAAEGGCDISLEADWPPAFEGTTDLPDHGDFKEAAAPGSSDTAES
jgi:hypothetical protein